MKFFEPTTMRSSCEKAGRGSSMKKASATGPID